MWNPGRDPGHGIGARDTQPQQTGLGAAGSGILSETVEFAVNLTGCVKPAANRRLAAGFTVFPADG
ncbi:hypothetical protein [Cryobacterium sp. Y57]|uniref:hypothetical protein n=1 Tax=Cryobacterium sp. Y57 TaxID=2048287 RepID=UPI000CE494AF|nr:hypothetical protein [Cryobacterium sp. Y57]